ncbi:MAG: hypothetical protein AAB385_02785 [Planctomycetota bacterium]
MDATAQLDTIVRLFEQLGVEVRQERLGGSGGGLCRIRGRRVAFIDLDAVAATRLDQCVTALATVPEAAAVYISPELREWMDKLRAGGSSEGNTPTT